MKIEGVYSSTIFRDEGTGYTKFRLRLTTPVKDMPGYKEIVCAGNIISGLMFVPVILEGEFKDKESGGSVFSFNSITPYVSSHSVAKEYLCSSYFDGMNEATAETFLSISGNDIFSFSVTPLAVEKISSIKGVTEEKAKEWIKTLSGDLYVKKIFDYISGYGCSFKNALKLFKKYGSSAIEKMKINPYSAGMLADIPYTICDKIARDNGYKAYDTRRLRALSLTILNFYFEKGNIYMVLEDFLDMFDRYIKRRSAFPETPVSHVHLLCVINRMYGIEIENTEKETRLYLTDALSRENSIARLVCKSLKNKVIHPISTDEAINYAENVLGLHYSDKQKDCFRFLNSSGIKIITGGPGTGKSTVINGLIEAYKYYFKDNEIVLMAPTGRAAQRMTEITDYEAGTIHRMLSILPFEGGSESKYTGDYPGNFVIVDEASMIDNSLMYSVLKALKSYATVIFVGDIDQLPSVGAGSVLREMIASNEIETVNLDVIYRQSGKSLIVENAYEVNRGKMLLKTDKTFRIIEVGNVEELRRRTVKEFVDRYQIIKPYDVQLLSSTKKGPAGTAELNKSIQEIVNMGRVGAANYRTKFKQMDKIITTRNNYEAGYFNGDIGTICGFGTDSLDLLINGDVVTVKRENIDDVDLAYACTVHKSQGSEFDAVIICLPRNPAIMLKRNLLYTAITRAKNEVVIIAERDSIPLAISLCDDIKRKTALSEKIIKEMKT